MKNVPFPRRYARLGMLATTVALAGAVVVGSWMNYGSAASAVRPLNRGQADLFELAVREVVRPHAPVDSAALRRFFSEHEDAGLRYYALLDPRGMVTASVGEPAAPPVMPARDSMAGGRRALIEVGDRVRAWFPRPPVAGEEEWTHRGGEPSGASAPSRSNLRARPPSASPGWTGYHLFEFEPIVAGTLMNRASQAFVLACIGAGILTLAALLFWRTSARYDRAVLRLEEQKRLTVLGEMSAVLAHEIRNPLASLKGHAQLLAERMPDASRERSRAERVVTEAVRLEALTSDLLDFARAGPIETRDVDPVEVAHVAIADLGDDGFDLDSGAAPQRWTFDATRIRHALVNLLQNARQASTDGNRPRLRVAQENGELVYEVRDFGPGLPAGAHERIFEPFFTTRTNGTGLGLAVARRVAELHGGSIAATNHPEGGAVFRIALPQS